MDEFWEVRVAGAGYLAGLALAQTLIKISAPPWRELRVSRHDFFI